MWLHVLVAGVLGVDCFMKHRSKIPKVQISLKIHAIHGHMGFGKAPNAALQQQEM